MIASTLPRLLRSALAALVVLVVIVVEAPPAGACSCVATTDAEALARADAVFVGTVVETIPPPPAAMQSSADPQRYVFEVDEALKGDVGPRQTVVSEVSGASCGLELYQPGPWLIFASAAVPAEMEGAAGELYSSLCSGSRPLADGESLTALGGASPRDDGSGQSDTYTVRGNGSGARPRGRDDGSRRRRGLPFAPSSHGLSPGR